MRASMVAWITGVLLVIALYTAGPIAFNAASPPILGMPPLIFWFVLVPLLNPLIMGTVYLIDSKDGVIEDEGES